jgi:hypothetical protein
MAAHDRRLTERARQRCLRRGVKQKQDGVRTQRPGCTELKLKLRIVHAGLGDEREHDIGACQRCAERRHVVGICAVAGQTARPY